MTRLTNNLRQDIRSRIMNGLPKRDYISEIYTQVQDVVATMMPPEVRAMYDDPEKRDYLRKSDLGVYLGNKAVPMYALNNTKGIYGLKADLKIRMDDATVNGGGRLQPGTLYASVVSRLHKKGLVTAYFEQKELRDSVRSRLTANLEAATTIKRLYDVLEPELHQYIPRDTAKALLPATVAPVVDDLRKLGATLPAVPKAEAKATEKPISS